MTKNRWLLLAAIGAILAGGTTFFLVRVLRSEPPPTPATAAFSIDLSVESAAAKQRPGLEADLKSQFESFLNVYYEGAFLRPRAWDAQDAPVGDRIFADFLEGARKQAQAVPGAFGLDDLAKDLQIVQPTRQDAQVTAFREADGTSPLVLVTTRFEALATVISDPPSFMDRLLDRDPILRHVGIIHRAEFWFVPDGPTYGVMAFKVRLTADEYIEEAAFGARPCLSLNAL